jgi:hypothetical protein
MAERVEIGARFDVHAEFFPEVSFSAEGLADEGLTAGHVTVRLEEPPAQDVPFFLRDQLLNSFEEGWLVFLDPLIENGFVMAEDEIVVPLAEFRGRPEGGEGFARAFRPFPQPNRIEVGVADQMDLFTGHAIPPENMSRILSECPFFPNSRNNSIHNEVVFDFDGISLQKLRLGPALE